VFGFRRDRRRRLQWYATLAQAGAGVVGVVVDPTILTRAEQPSSGIDWDAELRRLVDTEHDD
jgi:hypothetical protein